MPAVFPFEGLTYDPARVGPLEIVTAPPYDVISDERRRDFLAASPFSVVHLDLAEGTEDPQDPASRYARASDLVRSWTQQGVLVRSRSAGYYAYEMRLPSRSPPRVRGIMCAMELEDWGGDVIPHERTMDGPIQDRLRLLRATRTHLSAVYGTVQGPCERLTGLLDATTSQEPLLSVIDELGVRHALWKIAGGDEIHSWLADEPLLIADGHHRYTTALHYRNERRAESGAGPWDRLLTFIVDTGSEDLPVLPFHRIEHEGVVEPIGEPVEGLDRMLGTLSDEAVVVGLAVPGRAGIEFRTLRLEGEAPAVRALHRQILDVGARPGALEYTPDAAAAAAAVRDGAAVAAWFLPATTPARIRKVVETGERLPEKSTYFWPKPRTGMIMMPVDS
jgi:uncharacterized protein (DUF1015 family)